MGGSTSTTKQQYPNFVEGFGKDLFKDASKAFDQGPHYFKGSTVTPFSEQTMSSFGLDPKTGKATGNGMLGLAADNANGAGMSGALQGILDNGGFTSGQRDVMSAQKALTNNSMLNSLINGNGLTGAQNNAFNAMQSTVANNNNALQDRFNNGGFDANQAAAYSGLANTVNKNNAAFQDTFDRGGFDARQAAAYAGLNNTVNQNNASMAANTAYGGLTADQRAAMDRYQQTASTPFEFNADFMKNRQNALDSQSDALAGRAAAAGRYGGGIDQAILAREQGNLASRMNQEQLAMDQNQKNIANAALMAGGQQAVGNQISTNAAQQQGYNNLGSFGQIGQGNQLALNNAQQQGYKNVVDVGQTGFNNQLAANSAIQQGQQNVMNAGQMGVTNNSNAINQKSALEGQLFNMQASGLDAMGKAYQTAQQPYLTQRAVGQEMEDLYTREMQDKLRKVDAKNPFNHLQQYASLLTGAPMSSVQTTTPSTLQMLLGGGLGAAGLLGGMGAF